ncbi:type II toxin-antitoxin system YefM family antitoxin [Candidatus Hepatincolaceae symbiont of Richtersius coronifer]
MQVISYSKSREQLAKLIDDVVDSNETIIITKNNKSAVVISLEEYNSWQETNYLLKSPKNAQRLLKARENVEAKQLITKELLEDAN